MTLPRVGADSDPATAERSEILNVEVLGADRLAMAERIDAVCRALGLDDEQFAMSIGVKPEKAREYRTGASRVGITRLPVIAKALGRSPRWILFGDAFTDPDETEPEFPRQPLEERAWRAATKAADLAASVAHVCDLSRELTHMRVSVPHGRLMATALRRAARTIQALDGMATR